MSLIETPSGACMRAASMTGRATSETFTCSLARASRSASTWLVSRMLSIEMRKPLRLVGDDGEETAALLVW